jgi:hypothetical protein
MRRRRCSGWAEHDADTEKFRGELRAQLAVHRPSVEEMRAEPTTNSAHLTRWSHRWQRELFDARAAALACRSSSSGCPPKGVGHRDHAAAQRGS